MMDGSTNPTCRCSRLRAVLPHEWIFAAFLLVFGCRLFAHGGAARDWSWVYFGCVLACVAVFFWAEKNPTPWRWRVRLLTYPSVMGISFYAMGIAVPLLGNGKVDTLLLGWDRALLGETPAVAWQKFLGPWTADISMAGYLFFFYYLVAGPGVYCVKDLRKFRTCIVGLFTMYGFAFTGYTVMPAGGPWRWMMFDAPLHGPLILDWVLGPVNDGSNAVDVFPSVHLAASLYLLMFDWQNGRRRFWIYLVPCLILWWSTMFLRFHYFVDLICGAACALAGWWMAQAYDRQTRNEPMLASEFNEQKASR